jgi:thiamine biosynthesis lipoprotein
MPGGSHLTTRLAGHRDEPQNGRSSGKQATRARSSHPGTIPHPLIRVMIRRIVRPRERVMNRIRLIAFVLASLSVLPTAGAAEPMRISGRTMGSYYAISIDNPGTADAKQIQAEIDAKLDAINRQMSTWDESSEISGFNRSTSTDWFPVSHDFAIVVQEAIRLHHLTKGALDITIAPLIDVWGFGKEKRKTVPAENEIRAALARVGSNRLEVRLDPPAIRKTQADVQISLSCLAPGHAADLISELLAKRGLKAHVVDIGGENRAGASKSDGSPWRLGVESPLGGLHKVIPLTEMAIATSGDYRSFFVAGGRRYSHVIDPRTGTPVENPPASVSVIHSSCMTADGFATAMMVTGSEAGLKIASEAGIDVMFQDVDSSGTLKESSSGIFRDVE